MIVQGADQEVVRPEASDRIVTCIECNWWGRLGQAVVGDALRCPRCGSSCIGYVVPDVPFTLQ